MRFTDWWRRYREKKGVDHEPRRIAAYATGYADGHRDGQFAAVDMVYLVMRAHGTTRLVRMPSDARVVTGTDPKTGDYIIEVVS